MTDRGGAPPKAQILGERRRDVLLTAYTFRLNDPEWSWLRAFFPKNRTTVKMHLADVITLKRVFLFAADRLVFDEEGNPIAASRPDHKAVEVLEDRAEGVLEREAEGGGILSVMFAGSREHRMLADQHSADRFRSQESEVVEGKFDDVETP